LTYNIVYDFFKGRWEFLIQEFARSCEEFILEILGASFRRGDFPKKAPPLKKTKTQKYCNFFLAVEASKF